MAAIAAFDTSAYRKLLARTLPKAIKTLKEQERMTAELERLDNLGRPLTAEEKVFAELVTILIRQFETSRYPLGHAEPVEALRVMMEQHNLRQRDLVPVFGSSSIVSDVLNGKRGISKSQAKKLAGFFHVPADLFI